jgi:hypothetical protein
LIRMREVNVLEERGHRRGEGEEAESHFDEHRPQESPKNSALAGGEAGATPPTIRKISAL